MIIDYDKFVELLNSLGLSLEVKKRIAKFTDVETGMPMESYVSYKEKENTGDVKELFTGWPFYVAADNKCYKLCFSFENNKIKLDELTKTTRLEPHVYEEIKLKHESDISYSLEKITYEKPLLKSGYESLGGNLLSNIRFYACEETDYKIGKIITMSPISGPNRKKNEMFFSKDEDAVLIDHTVCDDITKVMSYEEAIKLIEESQLFKDTMNMFCPIVAEKYSQIKGAVK